MHLLILPRGIKHDVDRFINDLQAQYFSYVPKGKMKEEFERNMKCKLNDGQAVGVQLAVRPLIPYELVFPEGSLPNVLSTIWNNEEYPASANWKIDMVKRAMCRTYGASILPKELWNSKASAGMIYKQNVGVDLIGYKEDKKDADGNEML